MTFHISSLVPLHFPVINKLLHALLPQDQMGQAPDHEAAQQYPETWLLQQGCAQPNGRARRTERGELAEHSQWRFLSSWAEKTQTYILIHKIMQPLS